jgi:hypothetical protein
MILNFILSQSINSKRALTLFGEIIKERVRECGVDLLLMQAASSKQLASTTLNEMQRKKLVNHQIKNAGRALVCGACRVS